MIKLLPIFLLLLSLNIYSQNLEDCGIDDNPKLTSNESDFLSKYMNETQLNNIDLSDKSVIFLTGTSANKFGTKTEYFNQIKRRHNEGNKIATSAIELTSEESLVSGGYDLIITYWVKIMSEQTRKKAILAIKVKRKH